MSMSSSVPLLTAFILLVCCVRCTRMVESSVEFSTQQHHRSTDVEVKEQTYGGTNAPVGDAVVGEVGQVNRKPHRRDRPEHNTECCARDHRPIALPGVGTEMVDHGKHHC